MDKQFKNRQPGQYELYATAELSFLQHQGITAPKIQDYGQVHLTVYGFTAEEVAERILAHPDYQSVIIFANKARTRQMYPAVKNDGIPF